MKNYNDLLIEAALTGDMAGVRSALSAGADVNAVDNNDNKLTALAAACSNGHYEVAEYLLTMGAKTDVVAGHAGAKTPLSYAAIRGDIPLAELLLLNGAGVDFQDAFEWTPLHFACYHGQVEMARFLMEHGADPHVEDDLNRTTLMYACHGDKPELVRMLLDAGVNPLHEDIEMCDALLWVDEGENAVEIAGMLVAEGLSHCSSFTWLFCTPLVRAVAMGNRSLAEFWLSQGAGLDETSMESDSLVAVACMCEQWDLIPWLLEIGCDVISGNNEWETPLTYTVKAEKFRPDIAELLVQHGACVNTCDSDDKNILELAATPEAREWLIAHGCTGESPEQPEEPVKILQRYGISDVEDSQKLLACLYERADTPLAYDFLEALQDQVWYLSKISRRDALSRTDEQGRTLLMRQCALSDCSSKVIKVLCNYRPLTDFDLRGNSALWYALKSGNLNALLPLYCSDHEVTRLGEDGLRPLDLMYGLPPWVLREIIAWQEGYPYDIVIRDGLSVLDRAMLDAYSNGQRFLVKYFIQAGARKELLTDTRWNN